MKHKYVLYTIVLILLFNTFLAIYYAVQHYRVLSNVDQLQQSIQSKFQQIDDLLEQKMNNDEFSAFKERWTKEIDFLKSEVNGIKQDKTINSVIDRVSNLEQAFVQVQVQFNELKEASLSAQNEIKSATS